MKLTLSLAKYFNIFSFTEFLQHQFHWIKITRKSNTWEWKLPGFDDLYILNYEIALIEKAHTYTIH